MLKRVHRRVLVPGMLLLALAGLSEPRAQSSEPIPDGMRVGRWVLVPYLEASHDSESNIFRRPDDGVVVSDRLNTLTGGLGALLPVRQSLFRLDYEATFYDYEKTEVSRDVGQELGLGFSFRFSSGDELSISNNYNRGFADVQQIDEGGELVFDGQPYNYNKFEVEAKREVRGRQGYRIRVARIDLVYQGDTAPAFFDYRGFESSYEFRQPLPGHKWMTFYHSSRRVNHYDTNDPNAVGVPFRKEEADSLQVGIRGFWSKGQPFFLRLGYGKFRYDLIPGSKFNGVVGAGRMRFDVGTRSTLDVGVDRRALPSNFNTHYVIERVLLDYNQQFLPTASLGLSTRIGRNRYQDPITLSGCANILRDDNLADVEAFVDWALHPRYGLRASATHVRRNSNCDSASYDANVVSVGMRWGWY